MTKDEIDSHIRVIRKALADADDVPKEELAVFDAVAALVRDAMINLNIIAGRGNISVVSKMEGPQS